MVLMLIYNVGSIVSFLSLSVTQSYVYSVHLFDQKLILLTLWQYLISNELQF